MVCLYSKLRAIKDTGTAGDAVLNLCQSTRGSSDCVYISHSMFTRGILMEHGNPPQCRFCHMTIKRIVIGFVFLRAVRRTFVLGNSSLVMLGGGSAEVHLALSEGVFKQFNSCSNP